MVENSKLETSTLLKRRQMLMCELKAVESELAARGVNHAAGFTKLTTQPITSAELLVSKKDR